jgi:hypothetical protein
MMDTATPTTPAHEEPATPASSAPPQEQSATPASPAPPGDRPPTIDLPAIEGPVWVAWREGTLTRAKELEALCL